MTTGDRIRNKREELGISQAELARMTECSKQTIYKYEHNIVTNIPFDKVERIAKAINMPPSYLMGWNNSLSKKYPYWVSDILSDDDLVSHLKKLKHLNEEYRNIIYDFTDYLFNKEVN